VPVTDILNMTNSAVMALATFILASLVAALTYWGVHDTIPKSKRYPLIKRLIGAVLTLTLAVGVSPWLGLGTATFVRAAVHDRYG
jgi:hypothetical protein